MKIEEFLGLLEGVTATGEGAWVACCPAHGDKHPSMSVTEKNGKILVHCHAGCTADDVVGALGLKFADLRTDKEWNGERGAPSAHTDGMSAPGGEEALKAQPKKKSGSRGKLVCEYLYQDADGNTIYKIQRRVLEDGRKTFTMMHPDPEGEYGWGYGLSGVGVKRVPYHLPEVLAAAQGCRTVVIAEGEKDVDNLRALGFTATCNAGGAGKWGQDFDPAWADWFKGVKQILIVADNDPAVKMKRTKVRGKDEYVEKPEPFLVGQKHAWDVRRQLLEAGYAGAIKLMTMPAVGEAHPKDFTDWRDAWLAVHAGGDVKAAFIEAVKTAAEWPADWMFTPDPAGQGGADARVAPGEKAGRDAISESGRQPVDGKGRFGRPVPRAPDKDIDEYEVSFDVGSGLVVPLSFRYGKSIKELTAYAIGAVAKACPNREIPKGVVPRIKSWTAAIWLLMRGKFFWDLDNRIFARCMYLDCAPDSCKLMMIESDEFYAFVSKAAELDDVDPKKGDLGKIMGVVKQIAISDDYSTGVSPSNMWDRRGNAVYISSGDTQMYRLKDGKVELVQNGTDGVVFLRGKTLAPWKLVDGDGVDPFKEALIFKGASWSDPKNGPIVVRGWVLNLFACHSSKPPLLITGGAGSGKTRMAKGIKEILGVRTDGQLDLSVQQMEDGDKGLDAFWAAVNDGRLEVFDNLDTKIKWASDTLQIAATDGQTKRRTLYTTYGVSILKAKAFLIFTSNNPVISTEGNGGMADRLITVRLVRNREKSMDKELSEDISRNRDSFLTWIAKTVAKALADDKPVENVVNERHPDFGEFAIKCGRACGLEHEFVDALGAVEIDKLLLPIQNDTVGREILAVLAEKDFVYKFTSTDMSTAILDRMGDEKDEKTSGFYSSRKVGKALSRYARQLHCLMKFEGPKKIGGYPTYEVNGTYKDLGSLGSLGVDFSKSVGSASAQGFAENGVSNSPNSPYARAPDLFSLHEEEEIKRESKGSVETTGEAEEYDDLEF